MVLRGAPTWGGTPTWGDNNVAMGHIMKFSGASIEKYDAVNEELGWAGEEGKPQGLLAHAAGQIDNGFCVVEWWNSEADWDTFFSSRLQPAFDKVGGIPHPQVTRFPVHRSYPV